MEEKEKKEKETRLQILEEADEYKIGFYRKREINVESTKASNREREKVISMHSFTFLIESSEFLWSFL